MYIISSVPETFSQSILLVSAYFTPARDINEDLSQLQNALLKINNQNLIIVMDSNAHSINWYDLRDDTRGKALNEFISQNNYIIHNNKGQIN